MTDLQIVDEIKAKVSAIELEPKTDTQPTPFKSWLKQFYSIVPAAMLKFNTDPEEAYTALEKTADIQTIEDLEEFEQSAEFKKQTFLTRLSIKAKKFLDLSFQSLEDQKEFLRNREENLQKERELSVNAKSLRGKLETLLLETNKTIKAPSEKEMCSFEEVLGEEIERTKAYINHLEEYLEEGMLAGLQQDFSLTLVQLLNPKWMECIEIEIQLSVDYASNRYTTNKIEICSKLVQSEVDRADPSITRIEFRKHFQLEGVPFAINGANETNEGQNKTKCLYAFHDGKERKLSKDTECDRCELMANYDMERDEAYLENSFNGVSFRVLKAKYDVRGSYNLLL